MEQENKIEEKNVVEKIDEIVEQQQKNKDNNIREENHDIEIIQEKLEIIVETEDGNDIQLKMKEIYDTIETIEEQKAQLELKRAEMKYLYQHYCAQGKRDLFLDTKEKYFKEHNLDPCEDMTFHQKRSPFTRPFHKIRQNQEDNDYVNKRNVLNRGGRGRINSLYTNRGRGSRF